MSHSPFYDRRAARLLSRVGDDLVHLRQDIGNLIHQTTRRTLPAGAKDLAEQARNQLSAGGAYAASRLRHLKSSPPPKEAIGSAVGVVAVGLLAFGAYSLFKNTCCKSTRPNAETEDLPD